LDGDEILRHGGRRCAGRCRVVYAGAEERCGFGGAEVVGDGGDAASLGDHNFGVAAVDGDAGGLRRLGN